jgi:hypothetical protein
VGTLQPRSVRFLLPYDSGACVRFPRKIRRAWVKAFRVRPVLV